VNGPADKPVSRCVPLLETKALLKFVAGSSILLERVAAARPTVGVLVPAPRFPLCLDFFLHSRPDRPTVIGVHMASSSSGVVHDQLGCFQFGGLLPVDHPLAGGGVRHQQDDVQSCLEKPALTAQDGLIVCGFIELGETAESFLKSDHLSPDGMAAGGDRGSDEHVLDHLEELGNVPQGVPEPGRHREVPLQIGGRFGGVHETAYDARPRIHLHPSRTQSVPPFDSRRNPGARSATTIIFTNV